MDKLGWIYVFEVGRARGFGSCMAEVDGHSRVVCCGVCGVGLGSACASHRMVQSYQMSSFHRLLWISSHGSATLIGIQGSAQCTQGDESRRRRNRKFDLEISSSERHVSCDTDVGPMELEVSSLAAKETLISPNSTCEQPKCGTAASNIAFNLKLYKLLISSKATDL
uniref:Uncharacterized protein n=1 Tax=Ascaris lumbricoides TaxID=6252 RepID=A0A0M3HVC6_ASCLU